jgi:hypothetical protein
MSRGITEQDVWTACDALLLSGGRPTIERVRQKIGRGSPNTVSPLLDAWFKGLGARIADPGAFAAAPDVPEPVQQAAKHFWETALAATRRDFDERLREGMAAAVANVEAEQERTANAESAAYTASARLTRVEAELAECARLLDQERVGRAADLARLDEAKRQIARLLQDARDAGTEAARARDEARVDVAQAQERATNAEGRAATEVERERGARLLAERRAEAAEGRAAAAAGSARDADVARAEALGQLQSVRERVVQLEEVISEERNACRRAEADMDAALERARSAELEAKALQRVLLQVKPTVKAAGRRNVA